MHKMTLRFSKKVKWIKIKQKLNRCNFLTDDDVLKNLQ